jgi:hypothetical protein
MNLEPIASSEPAHVGYTPGLDDVPVTSDPGSALLAHILLSRDASSENAREDVTRANAALEEARRQLREALERAREADHRAGFWGELGSIFSGDIAALAEVVASAAAVVATGGAGAAGVLALVAAGMSIGADVGEKAGLDPKICTVLSAAGAVAGMAVGQLDVQSGVWADLAKGARITNTTATTAGSGAAVVSQNYRADAMNAQADATTARAAQDDAVFRFNQALEVLQKCARDVQRADSTVANINEDEAAGKVALLARMRAA